MMFLSSTVAHWKRNMLLSNSLIFLVLAAGWIHADEELVWLEDVTHDHDRRHLDIGLPDQLEFNLNRNLGRSHKLSLRENRRLNANAPVYETILENGKQKLVLQEAVPILTTRFYHDKIMGAAVKVECKQQACSQRSLEGSLNIEGDSYEIKPAHFARSKTTSSYVPHTIKKVSTDDIEGMTRTVQGNVKRYNDAKPKQDEPIQESRLSALLRSLVLKTELDIAEKAERILSKANRQKRATTPSNTYAVEIVAVVDRGFWKTYFDKTSAKNEMTREDATKLAVRNKLAHIINGVSLRYESIDNSELNIYVTISKFIIYKETSSSSPDSVTSTEKIGDKEHINDENYLDNIKNWANTLTASDHNDHDDHIMVFTGYELYYVEDGKKNTGVLGVAYLSGACGPQRVSVQQDGHYFQLTSVAAHELGHNLGANHLGSGESSDCNPASQYIMAPYVATFYPGTAHKINPWRFSACTINTFKKFVESVKCLSDPGDYYNKGEWDKHNTKKPGELYSLDDQCKLIRGDNSGLCSSAHSTAEELGKVCKVMQCKESADTCYGDYYAAARGSKCGENKWCIDGECVPTNTVGLDDACSDTIPCPPRASCSASTSKCKCNTNYVASSGRCLSTSAGIGEHCANPARSCPDHASCTGSAFKICKCDTSYEPSSGTCTSSSGSSGPAGLEESCANPTRSCPEHASCTDDKCQCGTNYEASSGTCVLVSSSAGLEEPCANPTRSCPEHAICTAGKCQCQDGHTRIPDSNTCVISTSETDVWTSTTTPYI